MKTRPDNSAFEFFSFFEMTPDLVCVADKGGFFKSVNAAVIQKLGYSKEELFSRPISSFIYPEDRDETSRTRAELLNGKTLLNFHNRYMTKNGDLIWLHWTSMYFPDKEIVFAIAKDITVTKRVEKEIEEQYFKFKNLASHFKTSIEKERKYLALELHEQLAQLASVVKMDLSWFSENLPEVSLTAKKRLDHALAASALLIDGIRRITYSISPNMLEDLGLNDTLKWLCEDFSLLNGISCDYENDYNVEILPHEIQLDFFRICQEALTNVSCHAKASDVKVNIKSVGENICLFITDNGIGFVPQPVKDSSGLTNMEKRAASINGQLTVKSSPGEGTQVCLSVLQPSDYD